MNDNVWSRLAATLDEDERLIWPNMFRQNRKLYDKVCRVVYIVKDPRDGELTWVNDHYLRRLLKDEMYSNILILEEMLIVRLRLPWHKYDQEWLISREDLDGFSDGFYDDFTVIETLISVRNKEEPDKVLMNKKDFEEHREKYEVLDIRYVIGPNVPKSIVDPKDVHTWIAE